MPSADYHSNDRNNEFADRIRDAAANDHLVDAFRATERRASPPTDLRALGKLAAEAIRSAEPGEGHEYDEATVQWCAAVVEAHFDNAAYDAEAAGTDEDQPTPGFEPDREAPEAVRLREIARVIERADDRALAVDGPVPPTRLVMTDDEMRRIYALATGSHE